jgi:hypothetical protein
MNYGDARSVRIDRIGWCLGCLRGAVARHFSVEQSLCFAHHGFDALYAD